MFSRPEGLKKQPALVFLDSQSTSHQLHLRPVLRPSRNRHDPTNPHPVAVVSDEECPELTRISPGLSGITQAGEGLSMIASLAMGWRWQWGWGWGRGFRALQCVHECNLRRTCVRNASCVLISGFLSGATSLLLSAQPENPPEQMGDERLAGPPLLCNTNGLICNRCN